jgi:hypothetical protein
MHNSTRLLKDHWYSQIALDVREIDRQEYRIPQPGSNPICGSENDPGKNLLLFEDPLKRISMKPEQ